MEFREREVLWEDGVEDLEGQSVGLTSQEVERGRGSGNRTATRGWVVALKPVVVKLENCIYMGYIFTSFLSTGKSDQFSCRPKGQRKSVSHTGVRCITLERSLSRNMAD